jgi:hypothetical protein
MVVGVGVAAGATLHVAVAAVVWVVAVIWWEEAAGVVAVSGAGEAVSVLVLMVGEGVEVRGAGWAGCCCTCGWRGQSEPHTQCRVLTISTVVHMLQVLLVSLDTAQRETLCQLVC